MAKNVMKLLKPSPNLGKNGFDLSHRKLFDAQMGELLPCCVIETVPDDDIAINVSDLLRAMPMVTSPFMRLKQHIDFWFVPYNALWHQWNAFITSRDEPSSSRLQYSGYLPHLNLRNLKAAINSNSYAKSVHGSNSQYKEGAWKLLDLLGYPTYNYVYGDPSDIPYIYDNVDVNAFRLAAYQFIWYHEYRQKYYDSGSLNFNPSTPAQNYAVMFNFDFCDCSSYAGADIINQTPSGILSGGGIEGVLCNLRYRTWKKDLFTGLLPSTQLGAVSTVNSNSGNIYLSTANNFTTTVTSLEGRKTTTGLINLNQSGGNSSNLYTTVSTSILALRSAQALQIWRENALRAGNQIQDNYRAHYGVEPHSHVIEHPIAIGSIDAPLNISDVTATSSTGSGSPNDSVGDIAGKGISSMDGNKTLRFKTNDFGIVMGIFSLLPEAEYNSVGIDRPNQLLERFDFFMPEMENLGLEAVDSKTFSCNADFVAGYAPRYYAYKTILDKAHLGFLNDPSSSYIQGPYRAWASAKYDAMRGSTALPLTGLYVNPAIFDVNFVGASQGYSQFLVDMYNNVTAVRPMSVTGMPSK